MRALRSLLRTSCFVTLSSRPLEVPLPQHSQVSQTTERHPNSARFHSLLAEAGELHDKKQADYGRDQDPFANVRSSSEWGVDSWVGAMVRLNDKVKRLQSLAKKG